MQSVVSTNCLLPNTCVDVSVDHLSSRVNLRARATFTMQHLRRYLDTLEPVVPDPMLYPVSCSLLATGLLLVIMAKYMLITCRLASGL